MLGGNAALRELIDQAHARGMRVVLDGVFNHASRGFFQFHDILENGAELGLSRLVHRPGLAAAAPTTPDEHRRITRPGGACPRCRSSTPTTPACASILWGSAGNWIEFGIDGWRLDVPNEIDDDSFWQEFRRAVQGANPEAYIVGEVWVRGQRWLQGDKWDAMMNYVFARLAMGFCGAATLNTEVRLDMYHHQPLTAEQVRQGIDAMLDLYDWQIDLAQLNMLDSHDTPRALWHMGGDVSALKLCVLLQMTMPGVPNIYYGSEIGLTGGPDPGSRGAFPWDEQQWNTDLLDHFRRAVSLRRQYPALQTGSFRSLYGQDGVYAFLREQEGQQLIAAFNTNQTPATVDLPLPEGAEPGRSFGAAWGAGAYTATAGHLSGVHIPAREGIVLLVGGPLRPLTGRPSRTVPKQTAGTSNKRPQLPLSPSTYGRRARRLPLQRRRTRAPAG